MPPRRYVNDYDDDDDGWGEEKEVRQECISSLKSARFPLNFLLSAITNCDIFLAVGAFTVRRNGKPERVWMALSERNILMICYEFES